MKKDTPSSAKRKDTRLVQGGSSTINKKSVGWWERDPNFVSYADDDIIIYSLPVIYDGRPDLLSYDLYDNNNLEWVILQFNRIVDINEEFVAGVRLRVPSRNRLYTSLLVKSVSHENNSNV